MFRSSKDIVDFVPKEMNTEKPEVTYYNCDYCSDGGWTSETEIEVHRAVVHTQQLLDIMEANKNTCKICVKQFDNIDDLHKHMLVQHLYSSEDALRVEREIFICDTCNELFFNKLLLELHIKHIHMKLKGKHKYKCPRCNKDLKMENIWFHFQSHNIQSVSVCKICLKKCANRNHLHEHLKSHPKYLKCDICLYETRRADLFHQHILSKHKTLAADQTGNAKRYFAPIQVPPWKFPKLTSLKGIMLTNKLKICILCREICKDKQTMANHIFLDHSVLEIKTKQEYKCTCGLIFTNMVLLKHHTFKLQGDHRYESTLLCPA